MRNIKVFAVIILAILALSLIFSNSADPSNQLLFGLKRFQENIFANFKQDKLDYSNELLDKRVTELKQLANKEKSRYLWSASLRYSTTAGKITELIVAQNSKEKATIQIEIFNSDKEQINKAWQEFPRDFGNEDWKFLEDAINYLNIYTEQLSKI
ncbi:hypothetical protein HYW42_04965 [Candidatus Daviesbacteria bacterium]|nr:hypothetical protein [Candidatus Daviesbacteria bacterium]